MQQSQPAPGPTVVKLPRRGKPRPFPTFAEFLDANLPQWHRALEALAQHTADPQLSLQLAHDLLKLELLHPTPGADQERLKIQWAEHIVGVAEDAELPEALRARAYLVLVRLKGLLARQQQKPAPAGGAEGLQDYSHLSREELEQKLQEAGG